MNRLARITLLLLAASIWMTEKAAACAVCTGSSDAEIAPAVNASILFLLGAIGAVASLFFGFLIYLARRDGLPASDHQELSGSVIAPAPQQS